MRPKKPNPDPIKTDDEIHQEARWREQAKAIVSAVLERCKEKPDKTLLKELGQAYPFGSRAPARIWGAEVRRQRKLRKTWSDPRQAKLFEDV